MSYYHVKPIHLELRPSASLAWLLTLFMVMNLTILLLLPVVFAIKAPLVAVVIAAGIYAVRRHALLLTANAVVGVSVNHESKLQLILKDGRQYQAGVSANSFVASYLTVLQLKVEAQRWHIPLILLPDSVAPDRFRELRVWLKWGRESVT